MIAFFFKDLYLESYAGDKTRKACNFSDNVTVIVIWTCPEIWTSRRFLSQFSYTKFHKNPFSNSKVDMRTDGPIR
jgi:hypothetical protein